MATTPGRPRRRDELALVQLFLPLQDNDGVAFPASAFERVHAELRERFGGVTAFLHSPAVGAWKDGDETVRDRVVLYEVMAERLEASWWTAYREDLERRFRQDSVVVRALTARRL
ncbi:MAG TPA: hypothetical protein VEL07_17025 [Planctomycetota bacterium]|nr:hypothetical protein [Planctomycetota bacterium]